MIAAGICFGCVGIFLGFLFTLFLVNFDGKWKLMIEIIGGLGGNGASILGLFNLFEITEQNMKFISTSALIVGFMVAVVVTLWAMCHIIKDRDNEDILRIRDIILGQKSYIEKYYEARKREIDERLGVEQLEKRERAIINKENILLNREKSINDEFNRIKELGKNKLKLSLPEKGTVTLTKEYLQLMPSYFKDIINCIENLKYYENMCLQQTTCDISSLKAYLISLSTSISSYIFNGNSSDIRIHFRYYNKEKRGYDKLVAIKGKTIVEADMTFIPYDEDNMIIRSFECKRALIKSINIEYDYKSDNFAVWKDYLTFTFYNMKIEGIPILSFGISVKNEVRYKKIFHFINYLGFEEYLQETLESVNSKFSIENILYGGNNG